MVRGIRLLCTKPEDLSWIPETTWQKEHPAPYQLSSDPLTGVTVVVFPDMYTHKEV